MSTNQNSGMHSNPDENIKSTELLLLSVMSAVVYSVLALLIFRYVQDISLWETFQHGYSIPFQLLVGIGAGSAAAALIGLMISRPPLSGVLEDFYIVRVISKMRLSTFDRLQLSAFAGVGEELLFRGALQPLLGIWFTSLIFVGIHGYFKFKSAGHILFGVLMFGLSMMLGYLFEQAGLIAAMSAHAAYDIIMLHLVQLKDSDI